VADHTDPPDPLHALLAGLASGDDRVARWASQLLSQGEFTSSKVIDSPEQCDRRRSKTARATSKEATND
jgi:hypothetical protein